MSERRRPLFWVSAAAGWAIIGFGVRGALHHHFDTRPPSLARWFVGGAVLHDLAFAPVVLLAGVAIARLVPGRWRAPAQAALIISGLLALFAWPEVRGYGLINHNPSSLPHNYTANLLVVIAAVCVGTAAGVAAAAVRRRRHAGAGRP